MWIGTLTTIRKINGFNYKMKFPDIYNTKIAILGIGYVGLPLAMEFAYRKSCLRTNKPIKRSIFAFDTNKSRINQLKRLFDNTNEFSKSELAEAKNIEFTSNLDNIISADIFIITVPTPINKFNKPDLDLVKKASSDIGYIFKKKFENIENKINNFPIVIYESTIYPGATEDICIPLIEENSNLKLNKDFFCGYSPERINPGDKNRKISSIVKLTSGSNKESAYLIDSLYGSIIEAGTFKTATIKVAEAAKIIENTQRDLNIALVNEFSIIFKLLNLDTLEILEAAKTKWNFLDFKPGLVGGHCIGVDPYYLTYIAEESGYSPDLVLAGRKINNNMPIWISNLIDHEINKRKIDYSVIKVLILGATFKENCPDFRNSKTIELVKILKRKKMNIKIIDPYFLKEENMWDCKVSNEIPINEKFTIVICAVAHNEFIALSQKQIKTLLDKNYIIFDLKGIFPKSLNPIRP